MKARITITLDREILGWIDSKVSAKVFANRSHALEFLARKKIGTENEGKNNGNSR